MEKVEQFIQRRKLPSPSSGRPFAATRRYCTRHDLAIDH